MTWLLVPILTWAGILCILVPDKSFYTSMFDRMAKGKFRDDRNALSIMLGHLRNKPDEWSISRDSASFPLQGAKQIYLNYHNNHWTYTLSFSGEKERVLDGHFGAQFSQAISQENDRRQSRALMRNLYNMDGPLLLK